MRNVGVFMAGSLAACAVAGDRDAGHAGIDLSVPGPS
jgi:hypothetical protein